MDTCESTHLFPIVPGNRSQRRSRDRGGLELFLVPHTTLVNALVYVVIKQLVEDPNRPELGASYGGNAGPWDRWII